MSENHISAIHIFRKFVCTILILSFLSLSTPAAPEETTGWAVGTWQDLRFRFLQSQLAINGPGWLATFFAGKKNSRVTREVDRIQVSPGFATAEVEQEVVFSAVAFDRNGEPLSGVTFSWSSSELGTERSHNWVRGGVFKARRAGSFVVKAQARGRQALVQVNVVPRTIVPVGTRVRSTSSRTGLGPVIGITTADGTVQASKAGVKGTNTPANGDSARWDDDNWTSADDPGNQTGNPPGGPADDGAGNGNFQIGAPVVSLPGRGIDLALNLNYNSRLWNKAGSEVTYDIDAGFPAPGWSLGFGKMVNMGSNGGCMLIDADGTRHGYAGSIATWGSGFKFTGHTSDGKFIDYGCSFAASSAGGYGWAKLPNGTSIGYSKPYPDNSNHIVPTSIIDANGNYISIAYRYESGEKIDTVTDTLGRVITFHYDTLGRLIEVKAPRMENQDSSYGSATTRTAVKIHYKTQSLSYSFSSGTTPVAPSGNIYLIDAIYYPATNTGYWFGDSDSYSSYGMITKVIEQRGMSWSTGSEQQGTITQGTMTKKAEYNYPLTTANVSGRTNGLNLSDAPTYTELKESWEGMDVTGPALTTYAFNNNDTYTDGSGSSPARTVTVTQPTGIISKQYNYRTPGAWTDGLLFVDETYTVSGSTQTLVAKSLVSWTQGNANNYDSPRPQWVKAIDENGHSVTTEYTYGTGKLNQITQSCDKDNAGATLRCSEATYINTSDYVGQLDYSYFEPSGFWAGRHIFNLVSSTKVKNASGTVVSRTDYEYDSGSLQDAPGVIQHLATHNPHTEETQQGYNCLLWNPPSPDCTYEGQEVWPITCHCEEWDEISVYDWTTSARGNVTKVTQYPDAVTPSGGIEENRAYDITGNVVTTASSCCEQISTLYDDPNTTEIDTQYAYPISQTHGASSTSSPHRITTSQIYDFNSGLVTSATDANGRTSTTWYNPDTMRPDKSVLSTGAYKTITYDESTMTITEEVFELGGGAAGKTKKYLNGLGQVRKAESYVPGSSTIDIVETQYTLFGEEWKSSKPYRSGQTVYWSEKFYDAQRRLKKVVEPDGSTTEAFYNETSYPDSATLISSNLPPGNRIRVMDAWGRERWGRYDQQGLLAEVVEPNPDRTSNSTGSIFATGSLVTKYTYDTMGRLIQTDQGSQQRKFKYDDLGRLTRQKLAEQTATLNDAGTHVGAGQSGAAWANAFFYDSRSNLIEKRDARNVKAKYSYNFWGGGADPLNRMQWIEYDVSGASTTVNWTPASYFTYMATGDKMRVAEIDTDYMVNQKFEYDTEGRVSKFTQKIKYRELFPMVLDYVYDSLDRVDEVMYPAQYGIPAQGGDPANPRRIVAHTYDTASRLATISYNGTQHAGNITYNASDQTTQIKIGPSGSHQVTEDYTFDPQTGLLTNQQAKLASASNPFINLSYDYARNNAVGSLSGKTGHLTKITDNVNSNRNREYEFDVLGRLVKAKGGTTGTLWNQQYTYDRYGNRTNVSASGVSDDPGPTAIPVDGIPSLTYDDATNRITTTGYQYDVNGNMTRSLAEDGSTWVKYEYDGANRLNVIKKDDTNQTQLERHQYDHTNARVQSHDPAADIYKSYLNAGGTTVAQFTETTINQPKWSKSFTHVGGSQLATISPNGGYTAEVVEFNHPDRLGTRTKTNQSAGTSYEQAHLPFGRPLDAESAMTGNSNRFTSYDRSSLTKLDYAVNRTYDSKLGKFTQVDPIGMEAVSPFAPQTLNMYTYCGNDPVNYIDPAGLFFGKLFKWIGKIFSAVAKVLKWVVIVVAVVLITAFILAYTPYMLPGWLGNAMGSLLGFLGKIGASAFGAGLAGAIGVEVGATAGSIISAALAGVGAIASSFLRSQDVPLTGEDKRIYDGARYRLQALLVTRKGPCYEFLKRKIGAKAIRKIETDLNTQTPYDWHTSTGPVKKIGVFNTAKDLSDYVLQTTGKRPEGAVTDGYGGNIYYGGRSGLKVSTILHENIHRNVRGIRDDNALAVKLGTIKKGGNVFANPQGSKQIDTTLENAGCK